MKTKIFFTTGLLLVICNSHAQAASESIKVGTKTPLTLKIDTEKFASKCNVEITINGVGNVEKEITSPNYEAVIEITPQHEGQLNIQWKGKVKFRGFNTTPACTGTGSVVVTATASNEQEKAKWEQVFSNLNPVQAECLKIGLEINGIKYSSINPSAKLANPNDAAIKPIYEKCDSFSSKPLKTGIDCLVQENIKTICDEQYTKDQAGKVLRITQSEAIKMHFEDRPWKIRELERQQLEEQRLEKEAKDKAVVAEAAKQKEDKDNAAAAEAVKQTRDEQERRRLASPEYKKQLAELDRKQKEEQQRITEEKAHAKKEQAEAAEKAKEEEKRRLAEELAQAAQAQDKQAETVRQAKLREKEEGSSRSSVVDF